MAPEASATPSSFRCAAPVDGLYLLRSRRAAPPWRASSHSGRKAVPAGDRRAAEPCRRLLRWCWRNPRRESPPGFPTRTCAASSGRPGFRSWAAITRVAAHPYLDSRPERKVVLAARTSRSRSSSRRPAPAADPQTGKTSSPSGAGWRLKSRNSMCAAGSSFCMAASSRSAVEHGHRARDTDLADSGAGDNVPNARRDGAAPASERRAARREPAPGRAASPAEL